MSTDIHSSPAPSSATALPVALLSGGGSGGHVFPGLAVAEQLVGRGWRVDWAGDGDEMEAELVPRRGYRFHDIPSRRLVGRSLLDRLRAITTLAISTIRARRLIGRLDAEVVVGTGGFASAPAVLGAWLASRPTLLVEPNSVVGFANRMLSRVATEAAVADEETAPQLRCATNLTGIPLRRDFVDRSDELPEYQSPFRILVLGGSQGAKQLNELVPAALGEIAAELGDVEYVHQCGERMVVEAERAYEEVHSDSLTGRVTPFLEDVAGELERCHVVISRAGAITLAEICAIGRPAILLPLAAAAGHQRQNAQRLEAAGAARVIDEASGSAVIAAELRTVLSNRATWQTLVAASRRRGRPDGAVKVADRVEALAHSRNGGAR